MENNKLFKTRFSVLMSIYSKEQPSFLRESLDSVFNQSLVPTEVILVEDGKLTPELNNVINEYKIKHRSLKIISFEQNRGLGHALNDGLKMCKYDYVFRMDTDDICLPTRFEKQLKYMIKNPDIDVLGGNILEFRDSIHEKMRLKRMPLGNKIDSYIINRNPFNHVTVCFKKKAVMECGGYKHLPYLEDYYLWVRMFSNKKRLENIDEVLVYVRIGNGFERRRSNKKQIEGWKTIQKYMISKNMISWFSAFLNMIKIRMFVYSPVIVKKFAYKYMLRK